MDGHGAVCTHTPRSSIVVWDWRSYDCSYIWFVFYRIWERCSMMFPFHVSGRSSRNRERAHVPVPWLLRACESGEGRGAFCVGGHEIEMGAKLHLHESHAHAHVRSSGLVCSGLVWSGRLHANLRCTRAWTGPNNGLMLIRGKWVTGTHRVSRCIDL